MCRPARDLGDLVLLLAARLLLAELDQDRLGSSRLTLAETELARLVRAEDVRRALRRYDGRVEGAAADPDRVQTVEEGDVAQREAVVARRRSRVGSIER